MEVEILEQFFFDASADAVAEERAVGHDHRGACRASGGASQLAHDELEEEQGRLGGLRVGGKIALDAFFFLAAERRVGEDDVHAVPVADLGELLAERVAVVDLRGVQTVQQEVHLAEQIGERLGFAAENEVPAESCGRHGLDLSAELVEGFDQETAGAAGRVEHGFAQARVGDDHEVHDRPRACRTRLCRRLRRASPQHGFIECAMGVDLVAAVKWMPVTRLTTSRSR